MLVMGAHGPARAGPSRRRLPCGQCKYLRRLSGAPVLGREWVAATGGGDPLATDPETPSLMLGSRSAVADKLV